MNIDVADHITNRIECETTAAALTFEEIDCENVCLNYHLF